MKELKHKAMNFLEFQERFGTEEKVIYYYINLRYNNKCTCNHCGSEKVYHRSNNLKMFQCADCRNDFSIFKGTIFENSSTDLRKWFYAIHLFLNGKKGISGLQLMRETKVTYKTAWRMLKQIRIAMNNQDFKDTFSTIVEIDETYVGGKPRKRNTGNKDSDKTIPNKRGRGTSKVPVVGIIDRENKVAYAKVALPNIEGRKLTGKQLLSVLNEVTKKGATVITDEFRSYNILTKTDFIHLQVDHTKEFSNNGIHTNNIESFWATLKRGVYGIYHSVSPKYMQNYVDEFCFRYNNRNNINMFNLLLTQTITK
jgi:transposase-like protein